MQFSVDIEPTNRCNAKCHFCPRDQTPHQGLMTTETFDKSLERAVEFRDVASDRFDGSRVFVSLCGLGEPLLNKHTPTFVRQVREADFECVMSSNAALLNEKRGQALLDAGLDKIHINVGAREDEYEEVYQLPWEKTYENVMRFKEMADGQCEVHIVLVDYRRDPVQRRELFRFWKDRGIEHFDFFDIMNRGGALFVDHMQYDSFPELEQARALYAARGVDEPACGAPFLFLFIGYDGQYYLCCSDWKKEVPLGSVFDVSFVDVTRDKLSTVASRSPVCHMCNHDPINKLTDELRAMAAGDSEYDDPDALADELCKSQHDLRGIIATMEEAAGSNGEPGASRRRLIPVSSVGD